MHQYGLLGTENSAVHEFVHVYSWDVRVSLVWLLLLLLWQWLVYVYKPLPTAEGTDHNIWSRLAALKWINYVRKEHIHVRTCTCMY